MTSSSDRLEAALPVPPSTVYAEYETFVETVRRRESDLPAALPLQNPYPVHKPMQQLAERWRTGEKSLWTLPVVNVYHRVLEETVPDAILRGLVGLDATISTLDDIIDTPHLSTAEKVDLCIIAAFANAYAFGQLPAEHQDDIVDTYLDYLTMLFQIPRVEHRLLKQFRAADTKTERKTVGHDFYRYRGKAITVFAELPALLLDLSEDVTRQVVSDLEQLRARQLIFKDLTDMERDVQDHDPTPILILLQHHDTPAQIAAFIRGLADQFTYSAAGKKQYRDVLHMLEHRPEDLRQVIEHQLTVIDRIEGAHPDD